jgi:hypothetical protein
MQRLTERTGTLRLAKRDGQSKAVTGNKVYNDLDIMLAFPCMLLPSHH